MKQWKRWRQCATVAAAAAILLICASAPVRAEDVFIMPSDAPAYPAYPFGVPIAPPVSRHSTRKAETLANIERLEGTGFTMKAQVNVRALPSVYSARVTQIRASGTLVEIIGRAENSSRQLWYAVRLGNGMMGYIRADLLNADVREPEELVRTEYIYVTPEPTAAPTPTPEPTAPPAPTPEPTPEPTPTPVYMLRPTVEITPEIIYVTPEAREAATPTPIIVYVTPAVTEEPTPQTIEIPIGGSCSQTREGDDRL